MKREHKKYDIRKDCKLCGMIHDGTEYILEDNKVVEKSEIKGECNCNLEQTISKIRKKCFLCGEYIHFEHIKGENITIKKALKYYLIHGNFCPACMREVNENVRLKTHKKR